MGKITKTKEKTLKITTEDSFTPVYSILGYTFKKHELIKMALTHRSFTNELKKQGTPYSNERVEFLGDAVLELVVSDYLYRNYPDLPEGVLTLIRSATVRTETLSKIVLKLGLQKHIIMGIGEDKSGGRKKYYILANVFEAIVGAMYIDSGIKNAKEFILRELLPEINEIVESKSYLDAKTNLQEIVQEHFKLTPTYIIIAESGPPHNRIYTSTVMVGEHKVASGTGSSKQKAEEAAATEALKSIDKLVIENNVKD